MTRTAAIIGAGVGGLSAALAVASRPGWEVVVIEAADSPGGKVGVASVDGVEFDTGPSLLTLPSIVEEVAGQAGFQLDEELTLFRPEPMGRYRFSDGTWFDVGPDRETTVRNIADGLGDGAARQFDEFMDYARRIWEAAAPHFVLGGSPTMGTALKLGLKGLKAFRAIDPMSTMLEAIETRVSDARIQSVLLRYATFNGSDPRRAPATLNCISWVDHGIGGWGVEGGMYRLVEVLEQLGKRVGARYVYDSAVTSIQPDGRRFRVRSQRCDLDDVHAVIVNADVRHLCDSLWEGGDDHGLSQDDELSTSGFTAVIRARRRSPKRRPAHEIVYERSDYLEEFADLFDRRRPPDEPTIYLCAREKAHRAEGWADEEPLFVMVNAPPMTAQTADVDWARLEADVVERLRRRELIDADDEVVWRRTPVELAKRFPGSRGSLYGAASNSRFSAFQRPANRVDGIDGMYLASGSAHPGGGVPLCIQSGRRAVVELTEDFEG